MKYFMVLFIILLAFSAGAAEYKIDSPVIVQAMEKAGDNSPELQKVIDYYQNSNDSLKLQAAFFLIGNMDEHSYVIFRLFDTAGVDVDLDILTYPNYDSLLIDITIIEKERGEIDYEKVEYIYDLQTITSEFLITQIDYAFLAWSEKPWAKNFSFKQFCRYILPYRGSNEPLEEWRQFFYDKYQHIVEQMEDPSDPIEAAAVINDDVKQSFGFDPRYYFHPTDQGLSEMQASGLGRCEDMTNYTIYAMRANGLAVTSDYTPHWANSGNNHAWNSIVHANGEVMPFMGAEANPGKYSLHNKVAKVYRKTYDIQYDNLIFQDNRQEKVPRWLKGKNYIDVTSDYTIISDVTINLPDKPDSVDFAYIAVFNSGKWRPIHWGKIDGISVTFNSMGTGVAYITGYYLNKEFAPTGSPFILTDDAQVHFLTGDEAKPTTAKLISTTKRKLAVSTDGIEKSYFKDNQKYILKYWNNGWQDAGEKVFDGQPLDFENLPFNSLYWLIADESDREERIFTLSDGQQIWW